MIKSVFEIFVDMMILEESEESLDSLSMKVACRPIKVAFNQAQGEVANTLIDAAEELNRMAKTLEELIKRTETATMKTRLAFSVTDDMLAEWWTW